MQRPVLPPGTTAPIHPVGFVVLTSEATFGKVVSDVDAAAIDQVDPNVLKVVHITPQGDRDVVGVVTTLEGPPSGDIASRIGGFADVTAMESRARARRSRSSRPCCARRTTCTTTTRTTRRSWPTAAASASSTTRCSTARTCSTRSWCRSSSARCSSSARARWRSSSPTSGLPTEDTSGEEFKFGSIVKPGHQGIWSEPLRTGKYTLNPRIYEAEIVPTSILTLNWSHATSEAHSLDARLAPIDAKSKEAFTFSIDLQVQIHVPDTRAPKVISMVGTMAEPRQRGAPVRGGQLLPQQAPDPRRHRVHREARRGAERGRGLHPEYLSRYEVETRGVYIQDVIFPADLVEVLTSREIAAQERATFAQQREAQEARVSLEQQRGVADMQAELAQANVSVDIEKSAGQRRPRPRRGRGVGHHHRPAPPKRRAPRRLGEATAAAEEALGLARAKGFDAQRRAIGAEQTALVAALREVGAGHVKIVPDIQVGADGGGPRRGRGAAHALVVRRHGRGRERPRKRERGNGGGGTASNGAAEATSVDVTDAEATSTDLQIDEAPPPAG